MVASRYRRRRLSFTIRSSAGRDALPAWCEIECGNGYPCRPPRAAAIRIATWNSPRRPTNRRRIQRSTPSQTHHPRPASGGHPHTVTNLNLGTYGGRAPSRRPVSPPTLKSPMLAGAGLRRFGVAQKWLSEIIFSMYPGSVKFTNALLTLNKTSGASGRTRTCNLLIRSQKLYPIELRMHKRTNHTTVVRYTSS